LLGDVGGDVGDLLRRQLALERRHPAAAVLDLPDDARNVLRARDRGQVRTAVAAAPVGAVARDAVVLEDGLTGRRVALRAARPLLRAFAAVRGAGALAGRRGRAEAPVEAEEPEAVAVEGRLVRVAARKEEDVLLAVPLDDGGGAVRAGPGLEAPELLAGLRV